ncbi:hydrophobin [Metarhizium guizhouense ARSEF 977]|uniref:Hydrophobin n=1 Tax=Metarhizium guizhouense (strain ARSEF 977) TaxID=1276136 RepID=A0A0B4HD18_METGA|nr:hydrophobin [Metarhizium guizhouense ARSEF 977]
MSLFKILVAAATVATALAAPHEHKKPHPSYGDANAQCGNHQKLSCCNRGDSAGVLDGLLGGNCQPINILAIVPLQNQCTNQVACCTGNSNGLINVPCANVNL